MHNSEYLEKAGIVTAVDNGEVKVMLMDASGCASCHNSLCMLAEAKSRYVQVPTEGRSFRAGEEVVVRVRPSSAYAAAFWLYGMPFLLIMSTLVGLSLNGINEVLAGLGCMAVLVPYYAALFVFRKQRSHTCSIDISQR